MGSSPPTGSPRKMMSHPIPVGPTLLGPRSFDVERQAGGDETLPRVVQQSGGPVINSEAGFRRVTNQIVPYKTPLDLVALFENAHSSQQLRRAPITRHKHPGHASYATAAMDRRPPPQQPQLAQEGSSGVGRAVARSGFQYDGPNNFRPGYGGNHYMHRGSSWARPGYGRGGRGQFRGRGDLLPPPVGRGTGNSLPRPSINDVVGATVSVAGLDDKAAKAEALLQQALSAIQNLNAEKGVGVSGQQVQAEGASSGGDKSKPVPLIEITKKKEGQDDQGLGAKANAKAHCHRCFA
jgi:hypothetical protein